MLPAPLPFLLYHLGVRPEPKGIPARITICADIPEICVNENGPRAAATAEGLATGR